MATLHTNYIGLHEEFRGITIDLLWLQDGIEPGSVYTHHQLVPMHELFYIYEVITFG